VQAHSPTPANWRPFYKNLYTKSLIVIYIQTVLLDVVVVFWNVVGCSDQQCTNGAWCHRQTADAEQRSKRPITY